MRRRALHHNTQPRSYMRLAAIPNFAAQVASRRRSSSPSYIPPMAPNAMELTTQPEKQPQPEQPESQQQMQEPATQTDKANASPEPYRKKLKEGEPGTKTGRPLRLYADGIFDLFHFGHAKALQQCKEAYPNTYLIVGCCSDEITHKLKGRTVMTDVERYESLRHCRWVDEVVEDAPWVLSDEFLEEHEIDYVCHDALPYSDASGEASEGDVYARIKAMGKFLETRRTDGISTSDLIVRIVSEYDTFIRRNLARGYTGKDMNVPFMKETGIKLDMAVDKMKQRFTNLFGRDGALRKTMRERRQSPKAKDEEEEEVPAPRVRTRQSV